MYGLTDYNSALSMCEMETVWMGWLARSVLNGVGNSLRDLGMPATPPI